MDSWEQQLVAGFPNWNGSTVPGVWDQVLDCLQVNQAVSWPEHRLAFGSMLMCRFLLCCLSQSLQSPVHVDISLRSTHNLMRWLTVESPT